MSRSNFTLTCCVKLSKCYCRFNYEYSTNQSSIKIKDNHNHTTQLYKEVSLQHVRLVLFAIHHKIHYLHKVTGETIFSNVYAALHVLFAALTYTSMSSFELCGTCLVTTQSSRIMSRCYTVCQLCLQSTQTFCLAGGCAFYVVWVIAAFLPYSLEKRI